LIEESKAGLDIALASILFKKKYWSNKYLTDREDSLGTNGSAEADNGGILNKNIPEEK
jgi:hypothetical protein